jgi:hypothetical protein
MVFPRLADFRNKLAGFANDVCSGRVNTEFIDTGMRLPLTSGSMGPSEISIKKRSSILLGDRISMLTPNFQIG